MLTADLYTPRQPLSNDEFERLYLAVRDKEQRVYTDTQLKLLPRIDPGHLHAGEWQVRERSANRLMTYLGKKRKPLNILEIGCGNGWLSAKLAGLKNTRVTGLDINGVEINQAKRVFTRPNLEFIACSFSPEMFTRAKFDVIVFAASFQYFSDPVVIISEAFKALNADGEIHLTDTHFYKPAAQQEAGRRTLHYYMNLGYPEMAANYHHHSPGFLQEFNHRILYTPRNLVNRLWKRDPFYWIRIHQHT
jgi:SAM-dependent methyltransferase